MNNKNNSRSEEQLSNVSGGGKGDHVIQAEGGRRAKGALKAVAAQKKRRTAKAKAAAHTTDAFGALKHPHNNVVPDDE